MRDLDCLGRRHANWSDTGRTFDIPQRVVQRKPNTFGLHDMHGGVTTGINDCGRRLVTNLKWTRSSSTN